MNRIKALTESGQAVWLDYIRRDLLEDGTLAGLVRDDGVTGVTSNPAIFQQAIGESELYDDQIREIISADPGVSTDDLYERLAVADIRAAADILRPAYDSSGGADGYVSLEVSPHLARDADETVAEAFSDMIRRSVPGYETAVALSGLIAARHLRPRWTRHAHLQ